MCHYDEIVKKLTLFVEKKKSKEKENFELSPEEKEITAWINILPRYLKILIVSRIQFIEKRKKMEMHKLEDLEKFFDCFNDEFLNNRIITKINKENVQFLQNF